MEDVAKDQLEPLLASAQARSSTELLLRVDPTLLARFAGWVKDDSGDEKRQQQARKFGDLLQRFGITVDTAREIYGPDYSRDERRSQLLTRYADLLGERFEWVTLIPIRAQYDAAPKYFLLHATDSPHGVVVMNEVVSVTEEKLFNVQETAKNDAKGVIDMFGPQLAAPVSHSQARERMASLIANRPGEWTDFVLIRAMLVQSFGPFYREKHHRKMLKELEAAQRVRVQWDTGAKPNLDRALVRPT